MASNDQPRGTAHGRRIAELRTSKGWSQSELARRAETQQPYVSKLEIGEKHGGRMVLTRIANALGTTYAQLMEAEDTPAPAEAARSRGFVPLNGTVGDDGLARSLGFLDIVAPGAAPRGGQLAVLNKDGYLGNVEKVLSVDEDVDTNRWLALRVAGAHDGLPVREGDVLIMRPSSSMNAPALVAVTDEWDEDIVVGYLRALDDQRLLFPIANTRKDPLVVDGASRRVIAVCVEQRRQWAPAIVDEE